MRRKPQSFFKLQTHISNYLLAISASISCQLVKLDSSQSNHHSHPAHPLLHRLLQPFSFLILALLFHILPWGKLWGPVLILELFLPAVSPHPGLQHPFILHTSRSPRLARPLLAPDPLAHTLPVWLWGTCSSSRIPRLGAVALAQLLWVTCDCGWTQLSMLQCPRWKDTHQRLFQCLHHETESQSGPPFPKTLWQLSPSSWALAWHSSLSYSPLPTPLPHHTYTHMGN